MSAASPKLDLLESLKSDIGIADETVNHVIELTPHLALAVALLYMIASDGEIEDQESSQLQSVLGGDKEVLRYGLSYVQSTSIEQFLQDVPEVLSHKDRLCILTNVCDSLLSDGHADDDELALFYRMVVAFGMTPKTFEPYYKTIALKNDKTVLGVFAGRADDISQISPHHALAIALLYMMTADGAIGSEEIGQLEAVIGEFEGLQKVALKYVRQTKVKQFLDEATPSLSTEQRLYILTNVCDSMLSDGSVALLENKLFQTILTSFGHNETSFESYYQTIEIKNVKPFDTREFKPKMTHRRLRGTDKEEGVEFEKKLTAADKGYQAPADAYTKAANQEVWGDAKSSASMGALIQRTMQDNIEHVVEDFGSNANIVQVGHNATDDLNVQKLSRGPSADNIQQADDSANLAENRQAIEAGADSKNRQAVSSSSELANTQLLALSDVERNLQVIDQEALKDHREAVPVEERMQNLYEGIDSLNQRLNRFERENKDFLDAIRAEMLIDVAGVVVNVSPEEQELINMVDELLRIENVQDIPLASHKENIQEIAFTEVGENLQPVPFGDEAENVQQIALTVQDDNIQEIALAREKENIQSIDLASTAPNYQRLRQEKILNLAAFKAEANAAVLPTDVVETPNAESVIHDAVAPAIDTLADVHLDANAGEVADASQAQNLASASSSLRTRQLHGIGRYTPFGLNWLYTHAKLVMVFVVCVFAMPMNMKLPVSRTVSGVLITLNAQEKAQAQDKTQEQTFKLVRLERD